MRCLECASEIDRLDNEHLLACCGLTVQEYALRHHLPLELILSPDQINDRDDPAQYSRLAVRPSERARAVYEGIKWAGQIDSDDDFVSIAGDVRRLDLLLWDLDALYELGFVYRQEYHYDSETHRVVARNRIKTLRQNLSWPGAHSPAPVAPPDFDTAIAVYLTHAGELHAGYLFMEFPCADDGRRVAVDLKRQHGVATVRLDAASDADRILLRTATTSDTRKLLNTLETRLREIPSAHDRFFGRGPEATVVKELVFDSAHFITDHPAKCSNLHGGRYRLHVKVRDRVDPMTGCVVDYGYLKKVVTRRVIDRFDHHNLNYTSSALSWRSSTEILCIYIWERLIDYLPGMTELTLYETTQSWCSYTGPSLSEYQAEGPNKLSRYFDSDQLGSSPLRDLLMKHRRAQLKIVSGGDS